MWLGVNTRWNHDAPVHCTGDFLVIEAVISQNLRLRIIGRGDLRTTVEQPMRLIEIHRRRDIVGNDFVLLPGLLDAVDLHREQHRNSRTLQFPR